MSAFADLPYAFEPGLTVLIFALFVNLVFCRDAVLIRTFRTPLSLMSRSIDALERRYNRPELTAQMRRSDGVSTLVTLSFASIAVGVGLEFAESYIPFAWILIAFAIATLLHLRSMLDQSAHLAEAIERSAEEGRATLALMTARNSTDVDEPQIARMAIESIARTLSAGVVGPIFYFILAGLPGLFLYKIVNTSFYMIDRSEKISVEFGWATAKLNSWLTWPVARLSGILIVITAFLIPGLSGRKALSVLRKHHQSYYLADLSWPVAAMAGAAGVCLGGPAEYRHIGVEAAWIGEGKRFPGPDEILEGRRAMIAVVMVISILLLISLIAGLPTGSEVV